MGKYFARIYYSIYIMRFYPETHYRKSVKSEQAFYDTSFKARILRYDSFFIGRYLFYLRYAEWYDCHKGSIINRILGGGL